MLKIDYRFVDFNLNKIIQISVVVETITIITFMQKQLNISVVVDFDLDYSNQLIKETRTQDFIKMIKLPLLDLLVRSLLSSPFYLSVTCYKNIIYKLLMTNKLYLI